MSAKLTTNVDQRLLRTTKFPAEFNTKVDMKKVNIHIIKKWVSDELARLLSGEDDVVTELVFNIIEENRFPNIKELQVQLSGFLDKDAATFCHELWKLCLSAQSNSQGIPKELLEAKKSELMQERIEEERAREEATRRQNAEREREREIERIRERERNERRGRGGAHFGRDADRRPRRDSRSPPPPRRRRRDDDDFSRPTRGADTWAPPRRDDRAARRRRSPSYGRSSDRSRSPPRRRRRSPTPQSSRSRSPRCRNTSSERSSSPDRRRRRNGRDRSRSPRRRSSPPLKRVRRASSSPARSKRDGAADSRPATDSSASSEPKQKGSGIVARKDLMSKTNSSKDGRLSQEREEYFFLGAAQRAQNAVERRQKRRANELRAAELLRRRAQGLWNPAAGRAAGKR